MNDFGIRSRTLKIAKRFVFPDPTKNVYIEGAKEYVGWDYRIFGIERHTLALSIFSLDFSFFFYQCESCFSPETFLSFFFFLLLFSFACSFSNKRIILQKNRKK